MMMARESVMCACTFPQLCSVLLGCSWAIRPLCVKQLLNETGFKKNHNMDCQPKVMHNHSE